MVYIYVCKRFRETMDLISGRDSDWVNNLLNFYCKHARISAKLERAEINPKKRTNIISFDSSTDIFRINIVYKDSKGSEHELKWVIKMTRSDVSEVADALLRHERQVFSRLMSDLMNTVKQRSASRLEGARLTFQDLLQTPEFIFEEIAHQADLVRTILVLDNLEEKDFFALRPGTLNLCHMRLVVKTAAKFHAVSLAYKQALFSAFSSQSAQFKATRQVDEVVMEGDNKVLTGRFGLFARFPFLARRLGVLAHLVENRSTFLDMFHKLLRCFPEEEHLVDIFEYLRLSFDDILLLSEDVESKEYEDSPLDAISLGVLEARSFLFKYEADEPKESDKKKKSSKLQRSQSERVKDRSRLSRDPSNPKSPGVGRTIDVFKQHQQQHQVPPSLQHHHGKHKDGSTSPGIRGKAGALGMPASPKCPKLETGDSSLKKNKFLQNVIGKSKDDEKVQITMRRTSRAQKERDPNEAPKSAALINAKFVTYGRVTRDLAVVFWTAAPSLIRRFYLIKMVECYVETLGITLGQMGVDTDAFGLKYQNVLEDFQKHLLYGFAVAVLIAMATTSPEELDAFYQERMKAKHQNGRGGGGAHRSNLQMEEQGGVGIDFNSNYLPLTRERVTYLMDLMRDVGCYVESKDFELGLPVTNFARYHELWSMADEEEEEEDASECDEEYESAEED